MLSRNKTLALVTAIALAGTGWLYAEQLDDEHEALIADQVEVVKAARNIDAGRPLTKDRITTERVPRKFLPPNPLLESELNIYLGTPLAVNVEEGAMLVTSDFSHASSPADTTKDPASDGPQGRLIIKSGQLHLQSDSPLRLAGELSSIAEHIGGYVVKSNSTGLEGRAHIEMTVRVPAKKFDSVMQSYRKSAVLLSESVEGTDVTDKFTDLDAQARNQRVLEQKLLTFVEKAKTVDDAISLEEKIQKFRMEAERLEGRAQALSKQDALSTVRVLIDPPPPVAATPDVEDEPGVLQPIFDAFAESTHTIVRGFAASIRLIAAVLPFVLIFGPLLGLGFVALRRFAPTRREQG